MFVALVLVLLHPRTARPRSFLRWLLRRLLLANPALAPAPAAPLATDRAADLRADAAAAEAAVAAAIAVAAHRADASWMSLGERSEEATTKGEDAAAGRDASRDHDHAAAATSDPGETAVERQEAAVVGDMATHSSTADRMEQRPSSISPDSLNRRKECRSSVRGTARHEGGSGVK